MQRPSPSQVRAFERKILSWFAQHGRTFPWRQCSASTYVCVLSEVLLQRTRAEVVAGFLPAFSRSYPSWKKLAQASEADLERWLKPLGLWRRRAVSLLALARAIDARGGRLPRVRQDIESLPGVGQYIANAICLFTLGKAEPLLDVNMARVLERCFGRRRLADIRYDPLLQEVARLIVGVEEPVRINWAILDLAAAVCRQAEPRCMVCPLGRVCAVGKTNHLAGRSRKSILSRPEAEA
jgi:A/G-specific adenine glycosylase